MVSTAVVVISQPTTPASDALRERLAQRELLAQSRLALGDANSLGQSLGHHLGASLAG